MESAAFTDPAGAFSAIFQFARGVSFRRESFGGILYHYEGIKPDPKMVFVPSPFLCGLLERMEQGPLRDLIDASAHRFGLEPMQVKQIEAFFSDLIQQGAIVESPC